MAALGDRNSQAEIVVAPCSPAVYLFRLDSWREAFPRHWHEEWGIAVILQGINRFWFRRAWHSAGRGSIVVVPPGEVHDGGLDKESVWGERMSYVPIESMARIAEAYTGRRHVPQFSSPIVHNRALARRLLRLHRALTTDKQLDPLEASECLIRGVGPLIERHGNAPTSAPRKILPGRIKQVLELLRDDPTLKVTLEELAARVSLSPYHLIRTFRQHVGLPPYAFLKQARILRAQRLLRAGSPIADAALAAGFSDQSHLTREFRRSLGLTPGQYVAAQSSSRATRLAYSTAHIAATQLRQP